MHSNWAHLQKDLLYSVLDRLVAVSDHIRFSAVCNPWLSAARLHHNKRHLPMLIVRNQTHRTVFTTVFENNQLFPELHVPHCIGMRCCGSSHGWLIFDQCDAFAPMLFNPFTRATIQLPPITQLGEKTLKGLGLGFFQMWRIQNMNSNIRVSLSEDPSLYPDTYQVLAFDTLNFIWLFSSTSDSWVQVQSSHGLIYTDAINDAIYYRGSFYVTCDNRVFRVEVDESSVILRKLEFRQNPSFVYRRSDKEYLAESCDGRLLYIKSFDKDGIISRFTVYAVNVNRDGGEISLLCSQLQNLGGETLFLGFGCSLSVLAAELSGCGADCIYYTDGRFHTDVGVYDIVRGGRAKCLKSERGYSSRIDRPTLLWIFPKANFTTTLAAV